MTKLDHDKEQFFRVNFSEGSCFSIKLDDFVDVRKKKVSVTGVYTQHQQTSMKQSM